MLRPIECFKEGFELIKDQYWILFAVTLVGAVIGGASLYVLLGAMMCGIFDCYIRKIDGETVQFETLFKGLDYFKPSLLLVAVIILPTIVVMALIYVPIIVAVAMGSKLSEDELITMFVGFGAVDLIVVVLMTCFHTLMMFSFPLLVDRKLSAWAAVKTSARAVWKNLGGVAGLIGVGILINLLGALACGVGAYFTVPIVLAGNVVAYRKLFPRDAYQGAGSYN